MDKERAGALSRRGLLRSAGAAGVAAAAGAALGGTVLAEPAQAAPPVAAPAVDTTEGPVVVHVHDLASGSLDVYAGTSHTRVTDKALANRLTRVAATGRS